jgi:hypothetical protein
MKKRGLVFKLLGILAIAVTASACSPKKAEQKAPEAALSEPYNLKEEAASASERMQGGGSEKSPFLIYTEADLRAVGSKIYEPQLYYRLMADITLTGDNDSDPDNGNWRPISVFTGNFNGNGHTITGLRINIPENFPTHMSAGMFGVVGGGGVVENLGLIDASITVGMQGAEGDYDSYLLVISGRGIGGIAGENYSIIRNCYVIGNIGDTITKGGVAGINQPGSVIRNCYFAGKVFHRRENVSPYSGGIIGRSAGTVSNCISLAESVTEESETAVGRIAGENIIPEWNAKLVNNYGWNGTTTGHSYLYYVTVPASDDPASIDGADLTAEELKTQAAWEKAGFSFDADSMWVWNGANSMPGLRDQKAVVPWPSYLENPATPVPSPNIGETGY